MRRRGGVGVVFMAVLAAVCIAAQFAQAASVADWAGETLDKCCFGGDIRIRQVHFDEIPIIADPPGVTRGGENYFFRFRTRLWGQYDPSETVTVKARLVNEFREFMDPDMDMAPDVSSYDFPDELVVDQLYLEVRNLLSERLDVKIGRQDMIYGTGKIILEGTPKDGSRTIYMDAAKLTWKGMENTTIDVFGVYNQSENDLSINDFDGQPDKRDVTGYDGGFNDNEEAGAGIYLKNKCMAKLPLEAYYIFKDESKWTPKPNADGTPKPDVAGQEIHTVGGRIMPKMEGGLGANLEVAYQTGETDDNIDVEGMMVDAVVNWTMPVMEDMKPTLGVGYYYLSGDDPDTTDEYEGWNPLWGRWPQYSELYIYSWDAERAGRWSNLSMPHVDLSCVPFKEGKFTAMAAKLTADENDGPGPGDERGMLYVARLDFTLAKGVLGEKDKLFGHLIYEHLDPDDYYNVDENAHFARWELSYAF